MRKTLLIALLSLSLSPAILAASHGGPMPAGDTVAVAAAGADQAALGPAASPTPYAGQESRQVKALSASEQSDLLAGKGMGLAKAAELNGYPGPAHVLELAPRLSLSAEQLAKTRLLFASMEHRAKGLGRQLVAAERSLDTLFATKQATGPQVRKSLARIGELQGKLRAVHLEAHVEQVRILSKKQIAQYASLRGYSPAGAPAEGPVHRHGNSGVAAEAGACQHPG